MSRPSRSAAGPQRVLFVGGMPRSGSTLLDLMAGQLPRHFDIGELFYMWKDGVVRNLSCACGRPFDVCPFWTEVGSVAFGGWQRLDIEGFLALQARVDTTRRLPLAMLGRLLPGHQGAVTRYLDLIKTVLSAVSEVAAADIVVDSTKRPSTGFLMASRADIDLRIVHVVRDPRGVVNSWSQEKELPEGAGVRDHLKKRSTRQTVRRWITVNLMTEALARSGVPVHRVRYEDLVSDPRTAMSALMHLWGERVKDDDLFFIGDDGVRADSGHAATGGRVRLRQGPIALKLDEAWRRDLPAWKRLTTVICTYPLMRRYGYK